MAWSTMFKNGLYGGSFFNSLFAAGTGGLLCADVLSFINMTSSGSRLSLVCLKKSAKQSQFILPRKAVGNTSPAFANTAKHTVMFTPSVRKPACIWSFTYSGPPLTMSGPNIVTALIDKHTVTQDGIVHEPCCIIPTFFNYICSISFFRDNSH